MNKRECSKDYLVFSTLPLLLISTLIHASSTDAGTSSSTPKNLVNLYTRSPNDSSTPTNSNLFQNEYQYHHSFSKPTSSERFKFSTTAGLSSQQSSSQTPSSFQNSDVFNDHLNSDFGSPSSLDYSYQDNRGTTNVPNCKGRLKLNGTRGFITDGSGNYQTNLQCIWLIDSGQDNDTIRIQFHQFNTECNYDYFYIFDGDSIYSPLVATLSGDMKDFSYTLGARTEILTPTSTNHLENQRNGSLSNNSSYLSDTIPTTSAVLPSSESRPFEIKTNSGKAFLYFHSDTAQSMPGFHITFTVNSCPLECSNRGECDYINLTCKCKVGFYGEGCQYTLCPNNCTSPMQGLCDQEKSCICNSGFRGMDCSIRLDKQGWTGLVKNRENSVSSKTDSIPARAFHQATVIDDVMWIIGGKSQALSNTNMGIQQRKNTQMVFSFNIKLRVWSDIILDGITGVDHLAELSGHSVAAKGSKIFIFGGIAMNNTILDALTVLDTKTVTLTRLPSGKIQGKRSEEDLIPPIAVVGHSSNIIDSHMYVFFGYNPFYGYLNFIQKFNLADNTWSIVEKKGSYAEGCIGHTSTYDDSARLVYIYGGHNSHRSNSLYSFDPHTEVWTLLQAGPSSRYYHNSIIINRQLIVFGGISYNMSYQSDQCFQQTYLTYDLTCPRSLRRETHDEQNITTLSVKKYDCGSRCWHSIDDPEPNILKRHGHTVVVHHNELILFGGFNGVILNDVLFMNISSCDSLVEESVCNKPNVGLNCYWNPIESKCEDQQHKLSISSNYSDSTPTTNCTKHDLDFLLLSCKARETCADCLNTNLGCVWCGVHGRCHYNKCGSPLSRMTLDPEMCNKEDFTKNSLLGISYDGDALKSIQMTTDLDNEVECKRLKTCYLCHSKSHCSWQNEECTYNSPTGLISSPASSLSAASQEDFPDTYGNGPNYISKTSMFSNSTRFSQRHDQPNKSFLATFNSLIHPICDLPCYMRKSCSSCTETKCIWCSTTEQCVDSSAYFAYYAMGQCMHYVAHGSKCSVAACDDIETCDKCLTNPRCGWLNDISNTGKGRCIEGTSAGPSFVINNALAPTSSGESSNSSATSNPFILPSWFYTSCPSCQCNGHSYCKPNSSICLQPCQDNTEGPHCEKCIPGYFGDPINDGPCKPCRCNGHAQSCNRETGKCYCSTKGIIGHMCNKCDDQNHYIGDPLGPGNGTCYYNLTTDYQYTFNMSKSEDHFYSDINFINVPLRKDSDVDFTIHCSRLALVNITSGTSYKNRKPIHTNLECTNFRLRFPHDRHILSDANYSFFVHVYKFQTPFTLSIAFSQHRTIYLPQFFFTFSR